MTKPMTVRAFWRCHTCGETFAHYGGKHGAETHADTHGGARIECVQENRP